MLNHKNLGIMGGTFDPIHKGHIDMAQQCMDRFSLTKMLFIPTGNPPHKQSNVTDKLHRLEMTRLAVNASTDFDVSDIEVSREGKTYTFDTLQILRDQYPGWGFYYIIGADTLEDLFSWYRIEDVARMTKFLIVGRNGITPDKLHTAAQRVREDFNAQLIDAQFVGLNISSTTIRDKTRNDESLKEYVTNDVEAYIYRHGLYK